MSHALEDAALKQLFTEARTHIHWQDRPVSPALLQQVYEVAKWGPTSMNCSPLRLVFVTSAEGKEKLRPCLAEGNVEKTMQAPATIIVASDQRFYEHLPELFPAMPGARDLFAGNPELATTNAFRNSSLQGAYVIIAARALGLDCGPMSGFDNAKVDETFFAGTDIRSNFLINVGYGVPEKLYPRGPRLAFEQVARFE